MAKRRRRKRAPTKPKVRFPRVETEGLDSTKKVITIFGHTHGEGKEFQKHSMNVKRAMREEIARFGPSTYVLAEGYEDELGRKLFEKEGVEYMAYDHIANSVLKPWPRLRFAERFEWFDIVPMSDEEMKILIALDEAKSTGKMGDVKDVIKAALSVQKANNVLRSFFDATFASLEEIAWIKEWDTQAIVKVTGVPEDVARRYTEKKTTFRSLMAARTAHWRSRIFDVALFEGMLHTIEIANFLRDPDSVERYVEGLDPALANIYRQNEALQKATTSFFRETMGQALSRKFLPLYMRWLAYKAYDSMYGINKGETDFKKYQKMLIDIMTAMEKQQACFCFSGSTYESCCEHLLGNIRIIHSMDTRRPNTKILNPLSGE